MSSSGSNKITITAPARICLFGDHQDYLALPVIACAIDKQVVLTAESNTDGQFHILMPDISSEKHFSITENFKILEQNDCYGSVIRVVRRYGCQPNRGYTILLKSNIPINAGVSSSSAIVVVWVHFLLRAFGCNYKITPLFIAKLAYEAEVLEHNSPGGKMDQFTIAIGNIIHINIAQDSEVKTIGTKIEGLILAESGEPKDTLGLLSHLRTNATQAIDYVIKQKPNFIIQNVVLEDYNKYSTFVPVNLKPYFYAAIKNHDLTQQAKIAFAENPIDYEKIGQLMTEHHTVLKDYLNITTPKIDAMILAALRAGVYGTKIVGSGGGGSIVALAPKENTQKVINAILRSGAKAAYEVSVSNGTMKK